MTSAQSRTPRPVRKVFTQTGCNQDSQKLLSPVTGFQSNAATSKCLSIQDLVQMLCTLV